MKIISAFPQSLCINFSNIYLISVSPILLLLTVTPSPPAKCEAGFTNKQGGCQPCEKGQYKPEAGQRSCYKCPRGTEQPRIGSTECTSCRPGLMSGEEGAAYCAECPHGTYSDTEGSDDCADCQPGTFANTTAMTECVLCPPGSCQDEAGSSSCNQCSPGSYQPDWGTTSCLTCPDSSMTGATSCKPECQPGSVPVGVNCRECGVGEYQNSTTCRKCEAGSYQPTPGSSTCLPCPANHSQPSPGQESCEPCPPGFTTKSPGSVLCLEECPIGSYSTTGTVPCQQCEDGTVIEVVGSMSCSSLPVNPATTEIPVNPATTEIPEQDEGGTHSGQCRDECTCEGCRVTCYRCSSELLAECRERCVGCNGSPCDMAQDTGGTLAVIFGVQITWKRAFMFGSGLFVLLSAATCILAVRCTRHKARNKVHVTKHSPTKTKLLIKVQPVDPNYIDISF